MHMCMSMCVCMCVYVYVYILFVVRIDFNYHHEMRSTTNIWCQQFTMIALKWGIVLFESQIYGSFYSSWKASLISKYQKCS